MTVFVNKIGKVVSPGRKALCMRAMTAYDLLVQWDSLNILSKQIPDKQHHCFPTKPELCTMGALSETSGAVVIHSKGSIEEREDRSWGEVTSEHIRWSGGGRGEAVVLGFPLTSSRLASSQDGVTLELEIWYMCLRFLSASGVRVSLASF